MTSLSVFQSFWIIETRDLDFSLFGFPFYIFSLLIGLLFSLLLVVKLHFKCFVLDSESVQNSTVGGSDQVGSKENVAVLGLGHLVFESFEFDLSDSLFGSGSSSSNHFNLNYCFRKSNQFKLRLLFESQINLSLRLF